MRKVFVCIVGITLFLLTSVGFVEAAMDATLRIDGVDGESKIDGHEGEIDVLSWNWGATQTGSLHVGGGGGAGTVNVQDVAIVKYIDKASVDLLLNCFNGSHFKEAVLTVRKTGETPLDYLVITMSPVLVTSVTSGGESGEDRSTEVVTLNFSKVKVMYIPQKEDGSGDAPVEMTWNIETNKQE